MAYKSRVTNKYLGNTAGRPQVGKTSELQQVVNVLATSFTPAMQKYGEVYMQDKKDQATLKMEELYASGKSEEDIKSDIMNNVHPELSSRYAQSAINIQLGKFAAADTIQTIIKNQDQYSPYGEYDSEGNLTKEPQSLHDFYSQFLPNLDGKDKNYSAGFSAVFNKYKLEEEVKDASNRAKHWQDKKIQGAANFAKTIVDIEGVEFLNEALDDFQIELPKIDGKKSYFLTNQEKNATLITMVNGIAKTATTVEELDTALSVLNMDRGKGKDGQLLGSLAGTNREDVVTLYNSITAKRRTLANHEIAMEKYQKEQLYIQSTQQVVEMLQNGDMNGYNNLIETLDATDPALSAALRKFTEDRMTASKSPMELNELQARIIQGEVGYIDLMEELQGYDADNKLALLKLYQQSDAIRNNQARPYIESDIVYKNGTASIDKALLNLYIERGAGGVISYKVEGYIAQTRARNYMMTEIQKAENEYRENNNNKEMPLKQKVELINTLQNTVLKLYAPEQGTGIGDVTPTEFEIGSDREDKQTATEVMATRDLLEESVKGIEDMELVAQPTDKNEPSFNVLNAKRKEQLQAIYNSIFNSEELANVSEEIYNSPEEYGRILNPIAKTFGFEDYKKLMEAIAANRSPE